MRTMRGMHVVLALLIGSGCGSVGDRATVDSGEVCVSGGGDDALRVQVTLEDCMSSACTEPRDSTCLVTAADGVVTVTSRLRWRRAPLKRCSTPDCWAPSASCSLDGVPAGDWTLQHGRTSAPLTLPTSGTCAGVRNADSGAAPSNETGR